MDLQDLADQVIGSTTNVDLMSVGPHANLLHSLTGSEELTRPLIATAFWHEFIRSPDFGETLAEAGASSLNSAQIESFVLRHGYRHDLLVFDPRFRSSQPVAVPIKPASRTPQAMPRIPGAASQPAWMRPTTTEGTLWLAAREAAFAAEFQVLVLRTPDPQTGEVINTAGVPTPPWLVLRGSLPPGVIATGMVPPAGVGSPSLVPPGVVVAGGAFSTVGVFATNGAGQHGVTAALHAIGRETQVNIGGRFCSVLTRDAISDSCFIEFPWQGAGGWGAAGPLRGVIPSQQSAVEFEGGQSGRTRTFVTAWSPDLIRPIPGSQVKLFTKVSTAPGDSGAALVDDTNHVVGFSFYRTGFGEVAEFSAWIWAESVFDAHQLV